MQCYPPGNLTDAHGYHFFEQTVNCAVNKVTQDTYCNCFLHDTRSEHCNIHRHHRRHLAATSDGYQSTEKTFQSGSKVHPGAPKYHHPSEQSSSHPQAETNGPQWVISSKSWHKSIFDSQLQPWNKANCSGQGLSLQHFSFSLDSKLLERKIMILPWLVNRLFPDPQLTLTVLPAAPPQEPHSHHLSALALLAQHPAGDRSCWRLQHRALCC